MTSINCRMLFALVLLGMASHRNIAVDARPAQAGFPSGGPITYLVSVKNVSGQKLFVSRHLVLGSFLFAEIKDREGRPRACGGRIYSRTYSVSEFALLGPGSELHAEVNLACTEGGGRGLEPGSYTARVCYSVEKEYFSSLLKGYPIAGGPQCSRTTRFEVTARR